MNYYKVYLNLFILLVMASCSQNIHTDISQKVIEIQKKNILDKRLVYFGVETETVGERVEITGATVSESAYMDLRVLAEKEGAVFKVELLPEEDFKADPWGIVSLSACNIRANGRHSAELVTQAVMGTPVKVYTKVGGWYLVQTPDRYFGWVDDAAIALKSNAELIEWKSFDKILYKEQYGFAYRKPDIESEIECDLVLANLLSVTDSVDGFYKIVLADGREAFVKQSECVSLDIWKSKNFTVEDILLTASKFKGVPYLWGGTSAKMLDCSGFTKSAYYYHGILLQRDASQQTLYGELVDTESGYGKLEKGDLVFFGRKADGEKKEKVTHVGICTGKQEFIHASGKVRINSLDRSSEKYTEYYETAFVRGRRIIGNVDNDGIEWVVDNSFYKEILN